MKKLIFLLYIAVLTNSCTNTQKSDSGTERHMHVPKRAMYHWKNTLAIDHETEEFLNRHSVGRLYVRFFDVTLEDPRNGGSPEAMPTATISIKSLWGVELPEIVPTIFITPEAIGDIYRKGQTRAIAKKMLERIDHMRSFYDIPMHKVCEVQLDCDWTSSTENAFFAFCSEVRRQLPDTACLSSTIRLHQLRRPAPPVDYGVLMLYNTNNLRDPSVENSILSVDDVKSYLSWRTRYDLPLDMAYPIFEWDLWFKDGRFRGILRDKAQADSLRQAGNHVRHESANFEEIRQVKRIVEKHIAKPKHGRSTILYHLDKNDLNRYSDDEIENIFGR